ncbi:MAG: ATP-binding cassette domain-containing protein, partial [Clostridiales bacterium]|nr:ATP-binding cassette domain-containing protein [Clostridiales bacterium]
GAGKSTLIKTILGLQSPLGGVVEIDNNISRKEFGYLPQQKDIKSDFPSSVFEIVLSGALNACGLRPFYNKSQKERANRYIQKLGLMDIKRKCFRELSGGQQQRVLLARALVSAKRVLFMDEPDAGLDPNATKEMYNIVAELNKQEGLTVVTISHDVDSAVDNATHILRVCKCGKCDFLAKNEFVEKEGAHDSL